MSFTTCSSHRFRENLVDMDGATIFHFSLVLCPADKVKYGLHKFELNQTNKMKSKSRVAHYYLLTALLLGIGQIPHGAIIRQKDT